jgi:hypothetical protein
MPNQLAHALDDLINRVERRGSIHLRFEPRPEALNRIIFRGIRRSVFKDNPLVLFVEPFDRVTFVNLRIIQDEEEQGLGKALVELMEEF